MRIPASLLLLCLVVASPASAQPIATETAAVIPTGQMDVGVRGTAFAEGSDTVRYQRYRDLSDGATLDRFRWGREDDHWMFSTEADHVGYLDQRFAGQVERFGRIRASFEWNQIPLFYSGDTATLYAESNDGELRIPNSALRAGVQSGALGLRNLSAFLGPTFDLRQRRDIASFASTASVTSMLDARFNVTSTRKHGAMPWGASFGLSAANEVAAPVDHRTTDTGASLEWVHDRGTARVGWDGSWFNNSLETIVFDSPLRLTDSTNSSAYVAGNGTSQGRMSMWPDSTSQTLAAGASFNLPGRNRVNGSLSIGEWRQDGALLPHTINTAVPVIPLDRPSAEAAATIFAYNVNFTSRPNRFTWLNVRARRYDFNNRTPEFNAPRYVRIDQAAGTFPLGHSEPFGYVRNFVDADASLNVLPFTALKVGYGFERSSRQFRLFETTDEHIFRVALDAAGHRYVSVRLGYEHGGRTGTGLDEEVLDDIGEQVSLRQFDISNRNRDQVTALFQVTPIGALALIGTAQVGRDERPDANFGLQRLNTNAYSFGLEATPTDGVGAGITYGYENAGTYQMSRQANPGGQFFDPTRDWFTDVDERVRYLVASVDVTTISRTILRGGLDWNRSKADYDYVLPADTSLGPLVPLPQVFNELRRVSLDVSYALTSRLSAGFTYAYENFEVNDFQTSPVYAVGNRTLADGIVLGYFLRPYTAHTGGVRLTVFW